MVFKFSDITFWSFQHNQNGGFGFRDYWPVNFVQFAYVVDKFSNVRIFSIPAYFINGEIGTFLSNFSNDKMRNTLKRQIFHKFSTESYKNRWVQKDFFLCKQIVVYVYLWQPYLLLCVCLNYVKKNLAKKITATIVVLWQLHCKKSLLI